MNINGQVPIRSVQVLRLEKNSIENIYFESLYKYIKHIVLSYSLLKNIKRQKN
jgi:hypothetical protein